jgi:hypothetical protein
VAFPFRRKTNTPAPRIESPGLAVLDRDILAEDTLTFA